MTDRIKHGQSRRSGWTSEYIAWKNMIARCERPSAGRYKTYGGRGIGVCRRWRKSFKAFIADMGPKPSPKHSLGRKNVNKGYAPSNCRWETPEQQSLNKTNSRRVQVNGRKIALADAAALHSIAYNTLKRRLLRGWSEADALSRPVRRWPAQARSPA